ncbi:MAG TPA: hypothetical protein VGQ83_20700 [Polyangia bacterium]|jgi:hypothetical protein
MLQPGQVDVPPRPVPPAAVRWRRVGIYYLVVYAVTYGAVGGFLACGGSFRHPSWVLFAQVVSLTPALLALLLTRYLWREPVGAALGLRPRRDRWLLVAWLLPWLLSVLALVLGLAVPGVRWDGSLQPAVDAKILAPEQLELLRRMASRTSVPAAAVRPRSPRAPGLVAARSARASSGDARRCEQAGERHAGAVAGRLGIS